MNRGWLSIVLAILCLAVPGGALAANEVFTVRNVAVDATAEGSAQARDVAIASGQRTAFGLLMHRLIRREQWGTIPNVSDATLPNLVLGFELADEHSSSTHYIAKVTYNFKPAAIRTLLRTSGIGFSESRAKPALLLAVLETPDKAVLWEEPNPWRAAWVKRDLGDDLVPIIAPLNDATDLGLISAVQARTAKWADVSTIAQKYGLERVIIADAVAGAGGSELSVRMHELSAAQDTGSQFSVPANPDLNVQLDAAVDTALSRMYEDWKAATIVTFGQENTIVASVWFSSLQDWLTIRRRLNQAPTVTQIEVLGLSVQGAEVRLHYAGTTDQLQITLAQLSLNFANQGSYWQIAMAEAPPPLSSPAPGFAPANIGQAPSPPAPSQGTVDPNSVTPQFRH